ncbi:MAG TPA: D-aminoacyl-tRNA deacylase [Bryobacteraceae bacterium]|jgi:D-tyrosyl-tRNA(Tyr) deacylase|nr:D-aminoacyl-tRNA deacylase [Bryobacteraceae bacterium]
MRLVIQRVSEAQVTVNGETVGAIRTGLLVLVGVGRDDTEQAADYLVDKLLGLRIFPDENGRMNRNVAEAVGSLLIVSQFTLYGDCRRGRRPSFDGAAPPDRALALYEYFVAGARRGPVAVKTGVFQASMQVQLVNDGPVTILLDSADR